MSNDTRLVNTEDLETVADLWHRAELATGKTPFLENVDATLELLRSRSLLEDAWFAGHWMDGELVAIAHGMTARENDGVGDLIPGLMHLSMVAVEPKHWRRGLGCAMTVFAIDEARRRGYESIQLWTQTDNDRACRIYESLGFTLSGRQKKEKEAQILHYVLDFESDDAGTVLTDSEYVLQTQRLDLRLMQMSDAESLFRLHSEDPDALAFITWHPTSVAEVVVALHKLRRTFRNGQDVLWAIRTQVAQKFIGLIHLADIRNREGEVHFIIVRSHWGQGIVPEALAAVLTFARERLALRRVRGRCDPKNLSSVRVFQKAGFSDVGFVRYPSGATKADDFRAFVLELAN
jgi:ribosomal-protein-alanine N-acetyltransferase